MSKVYRLKSDFKNNACFLEQYTNVDNRFIKKYWGWKNIDLSTYDPVVLKLSSGDNGRINYKMDMSSFGGGLIIFSEKAINILKPILEKYGQIVPIITESKRKKFFGFYANKNIYDDSIINLGQSDYSHSEKGKLFYKVVLNNQYPKNDYMFTLSNYQVEVFVTEKFKNLVGQHDLKGFDFTSVHEVSIED